METFDLTALKLELFLYGIYASLVFLEQGIELGRVHLADCTIIVGHVCVDRALCVLLRIIVVRARLELHRALMSLPQFLQGFHRLHLQVRI